MNSSVNSMPLYVTEEEAGILRDGLIFLIKGVNDAKLLVNDGPVLDSLDGLAMKYKSLLEKLSVEKFSKNEEQRYALVEFFVKENDMEGVRVERASILSIGNLNEVSAFFKKHILSEVCILREQEDSSREDFYAFFNGDGLDEVTEEVITDVVESRNNLVLEAQFYDNTCTVMRKLLSIVSLQEVL